MHEQSERKTKTNGTSKASVKTFQRKDDTGFCSFLLGKKREPNCRPLLVLVVNLFGQNIKAIASTTLNYLFSLQLAKYKVERKEAETFVYLL